MTQNETIHIIRMEVFKYVGTRSDLTFYGQIKLARKMIAVLVQERTSLTLIQTARLLSKSKKTADYCRVIIRDLKKQIEENTEMFIGYERVNYLIHEKLKENGTMSISKLQNVG